MTSSIPLSDLSNSPAAKFEQLGDTHKGIITSMNERPQTDPVTGAVQTFQDGTPRTQWVITLEKEDGEVVALFAKGGRFDVNQGSGESMLSAIATAVRDAGASSVDVGGNLAVRHTGLGKAKPAQSPPKLYKAKYTPPAPKSQAVAVDDLFGEPAAQAAPFNDEPF